MKLIDNWFVLLIIVIPCNISVIICIRSSDIFRASLLYLLHNLIATLCIGINNTITPIPTTVGQLIKYNNNPIATDIWYTPEGARCNLSY